jgi:hypothetical protein
MPVSPTVGTFHKTDINSVNIALHDTDSIYNMIVHGDMHAFARASALRGKIFMDEIHESGMFRLLVDIMTRPAVLQSVPITDGHKNIFRHIMAKFGISCLLARVQKAPRPAIPRYIKSAVRLAASRNHAQIVAAIMETMGISGKSFRKWFSLEDLRTFYAKGQVEMATLVCLCHPDVGPTEYQHIYSLIERKSNEHNVQNNCRTFVEWAYIPKKSRCKEYLTSLFTAFHN